MHYLDHERMDAVDAEAFRSQKPYPWRELDRLIPDAGYRALREGLPPVERFQRIFGRKRAHGQESHDRFVLQHRVGIALPQPWKDFVRELQGRAYRAFVARLIGHEHFLLHFHWHYTPRGCSVSPHTDATWKLGSQIFYFNTEEDWDPAWGGETVVLDDGDRFSYDSAPAFEDFDGEYASSCLGNRSLIFVRKGNSWHGVRPLRCPEHALRKVFIVEFRQDTWMMRLRTPLGV